MNSEAPDGSDGIKDGLTHHPPYNRHEKGQVPMSIHDLLDHDLNGRSLMLPDDENFNDDMSSLNSSIYGRRVFNGDGNVEDIENAKRLSNHNRLPFAIQKSIPFNDDNTPFIEDDDDIHTVEPDADTAHMLLVRENIANGTLLSNNETPRSRMHITSLPVSELKNSIHEQPRSFTDSTSDRSQQPSATNNLNLNMGPIEEGSIQTRFVQKRSSAINCFPIWIKKAPFCIQLAFAFSILTMLGSMALVGISLGMEEGSNQNTDIEGMADSMELTSYPTPSPIHDSQNVEDATRSPWKSTMSPSGIPLVGDVANPIPLPQLNTPPPVVEVLTVAPSSAVVVMPTFYPLVTSANPILGPTIAPTSVGSVAASYSFSTSVYPNVTTFYATAGAFSDELQPVIQSLLASMPLWDNDAVMFHLGDWKDSSYDACPEEEYMNITSLFSASSIPVYFVVGDNEYNDCEDPVQALGFWHSNLLDFPQMFWSAPDWEIARQTNAEGTNYTENYSFQVNDVVMCGLNLVAGTIYDTEEWQQRLESNLEWVSQTYQNRNQAARVMVILVHSGPEITTNDNFYEPLFSNILEVFLEMTFIIVHRTGTGQLASIQYTYRGIPNLAVVAVEATVWPPMRIQIDTANGIVIDINQNDWFSLAN